MSATALADVVQHIEDAIANAGLELRLLDVLDLTHHTDDNLDRGFCVMVPSSVNRQESRENDLTVSGDTFEVQVGYRMRHTQRRESRAEAMVLEEQIRAIVTSRRADWPTHLVWAGTQRQLAAADPQWYIITQRFTGRRYAALGG